MELSEYALELLMAYDGRVHYFASGHTLRFEVRLIEKSPRTPYGRRSGASLPLRLS